MANRYVGRDGKATKIFHAFNGSRFYISSVTIWEILLTNDESRREVLIYYLQNIAHRELINSPIEFIIDFIESGCPKNVEIRSFHSKSPISSTWTHLCDYPNHTFRFDKHALKGMTENIRVGFSLATQLIRDAGITELFLDPENESRIFLDRKLMGMKTIRYGEMANRAQNKFRGIGV